MSQCIGVGTEANRVPGMDASVLVWATSPPAGITQHLSLELLLNRKMSGAKNEAFYKEMAGKMRFAS
jgi:hypothetical protein